MWPILALAYSGEKIISHSLFYTKIMKILCYVLNTVLKVKIRMVKWIWNGCKCVGCLHSWFWGWPGAQLTAAAQNHQEISYCILLARERVKIQIWSSFTECVLLLQHHEVKNHKSNDCKLGTVCFVTTMPTKIKKFTSLQKLPHAGLQYPHFLFIYFLHQCHGPDACVTRNK